MTALIIDDVDSPSASPVVVIDYDETNSFGINVRELTFSRFAVDGELPEYMLASEEFTGQVVQLCREAQKVFVDAEQTPLELPETVVPQQISTKIVSEREMKKKEAEVQARQEQRMQRMDALRDILNLVYVYRRPHHLAPHFSLFVSGNKLLANVPQGTRPEPWGVPYLPKFREGIFEDGYFWTAVSMVAMKKEAFQRLFVSTEGRDVGLYTFQFYHIDTKDPSIQGWRCVTVDDQIPCAVDHIPVIGKTIEDSEIWSLLLEKAYAKFLGSYCLLHTGDTWDAVRHLTGGRCKLINWDVEQVSIQTTCLVWWLLMEYTRNGLMISTVFLDREEDDEGPGDGYRNLPHFGDDLDGSLRREEMYYEWNATACTVLLTYEFVGPGPNQGTQLVKMRNAYGQIDWVGEWADGSKMWTKETKEALGYKGPDDFVTWMKIDDFVRQFNTLLLVDKFAGAPDMFNDLLKSPGSEDLLCFHAHQYLITVVDPASAQNGLQPEAQNAVAEEEATNAAESDRKAENDVAYSFAAVKQDLAREDDLYLSDDDEPKGPTYTLRMYVSQPKEDYMSAMPREMEIEFYRQQERALQPCTSDNQDGYPGNGDQKFVDTNRLELTSVKSKSRFETIKTVPVTPGHYVLTLHQQYYRDNLPYCVHFSAEDDKNLPTGYTMSVEYIGSCANPLLDKAEKTTVPKPMQRQEVKDKIEKAKGML
jgi:hypothetical protein|eukprot:CAMPEP_0174287096 /NCGR_PEP_ID=MMETSP0809-20121228/14373_1 /TAXON_ID=73025 ORGANISM="Eutreptiella gymnastica-like, Strain CCMP1594" /NCGR_SAMPLE_ID=MMETSP0809 /ASSEMBLY_ACC=CAM_ASM_000658 /LENGTH=703 /DNA_ID=CAMNT_0015383459 /DNA_START=40 /DNA_END=2151 /DNA_ORIENTATION=-